MARLTARAAQLVLLVAAASAQPSFEVASIKVHQGSLTKVLDYSSSGPRLTLEGYTPFMLVTEAYASKNYQVVFAPSVQSDDTFFDILAVAPGDRTPTRDEFRQMLRSLLADRFHLTFHRDTREMPVYSLVIGKNGPKFHASAPDAAFSAHHGVNGRNQTLTATQFTMDQLADAIEADRPVLDRTGLTGTYDIRLEATPEFRINKDPQPDDIRVSFAVQDQLGLRLVPEKGPVPIIVIDHIEKPKAN